MTEEEKAAVWNFHALMWETFLETCSNPQEFLAALQPKIAEKFPQNENVERIYDTWAERYLAVLKARL